MSRSSIMVAVVAAAFLASGCALTVNSRSQVHYIRQNAEYDGRIASNPADSSAGSINAERTTEAAVNTAEGSASTSGNGGTKK